MSILNFDKESWQVAQAYAGKLGEIPVSFSSTVRLLMMEYEQGSQTLSAANQSQTALMLKSKSLYSMVSGAASILFSDQINSETEISRRDLVGLFRPFELASVLSLAYLFRKSRKGVDTPLFEDRFARLQLELNVGALMGSALPIIGLPLGILSGGMKILAELPFSMHDPEGYKIYLTHRSEDPYRYDTDFERTRWGCTTSQIAGCLLQSSGLGRDLVEIFAHGLLEHKNFQEIEEERIYQIALSRVWIRSLIDTAQPPEITHRGAYYPRQEELQKLTSRVQEILNDPASFSWLISQSE